MLEVVNDRLMSNGVALNALDSSLRWLSRIERVQEECRHLMTLRAF